MSTQSDKGYILVLLIGILIGCIIFSFMAKNMNLNFDYAISDRYKLGTKICESANSTPISMDLDDELVCASGATFDYKEYKGDD